MTNWLVISAPPKRFSFPVGTQCAWSLWEPILRLNLSWKMETQSLWMGHKNSKFFALLNSHPQRVLNHMSITTTGKVLNRHVMPFLQMKIFRCLEISTFLIIMISFLDETKQIKRIHLIFYFICWLCALVTQKNSWFLEFEFFVKYKNIFLFPLWKKYRRICRYALPPSHYCPELYLPPNFNKLKICP